jgi:hypothetical protein
MRRTLGLLIVFSVMATPVLAQKITIDYDHEFDFAQVKTFTYAETEDSNTGNQLTDSRIKNAILTELREGGLSQVATDGDLYVTYHVTTQDNTVFNTSSFGYGGWGPGWGGYGRYGYGYGGMGGTSTTTTQTFTDGTLIVDAYEPSEKKMVWRGTGTVTIKEKPEKQANQIDKILTKMGNKWDKILKNKGK